MLFVEVTAFYRDNEMESLNILREQSAEFFKILIMILCTVQYCDLKRSLHNSVGYQFVCISTGLSR